MDELVIYFFTIFANDKLFTLMTNKHAKFRDGNANYKKLRLQRHNFFSDFQVNLASRP